MKDKSLKKIVLSSIAILSSLLLIIGLTAKVICMKILPSGANVSVLKGIAFETGFSLIDFNSSLLESINWKIFAIVMGIVVVLVLICALLFIARNLTSLIKHEKEKCCKTIKTTIIINTIISTVYFIVSLVMVIVINSDIKSWFKGDNVDALLYKTSAFVPMILQAITLTAYLICVKYVKEKKLEAKTTNKTTNVDESKKDLSPLEKEKKKIDLVIKYRDLYTQDIISILDFERKKQFLLFQDVEVDLEYESELIEIVSEYNKIYKDGIIKADEFEKKKIKILFRQ